MATSGDKSKLTNGERLVLIEQFMHLLDKKVENNGDQAAQGIAAISAQLQDLDDKWDNRFSSLEKATVEDKRDLAVLKARGAGVLAAIGVVFSVAATLFSEYFVHLKDYLSGG